MNRQFYLHFETMPKGTSQQKRLNRRTGVFFKSANVAAAEAEFMSQLLPHRPKYPSDKPIKLVVWFAFDTKNKKLWGEDHTKQRVYQVIIGDLLDHIEYMRTGEWPM